MIFNNVTPEELKELENKIGDMFNVEVLNNVDILESALSVTRPTEFYAYSNCTNKPAGNGCFVSVNVMTSLGACEVRATDILTAMVYENVYYNKSWTGWKRQTTNFDLANYLSLSGGGTLDGIVTMNKQLRIAGGISPTSDNSQLFGSSSFAWAIACAKNFSLYRDSIRYGGFEVGAEGTESVIGYTQLSVGNNKPTGVKGNALGYINLYGSNVGCTSLGVTNNSAENIVVRLPNKAGTLMLKDAFTYADGVLTLTL